MSIEWRGLQVGPLDTNCYVIWDSDTRKAAIIDPGGDADAICEFASSLDLHVERVLLTHGHPDHWFVAGVVAGRYGVPIGMCEADLTQLSGEGLQIAAMFYDVSSCTDFTPTDMLNEGDVIRLGESEVRILHTPGHSEGGVCFVTDAGVFCGDTVFAGSIGRTDLPGGSYRQLIESIKAKILTMDDSTRLYPGHGAETTVGAERRENPFLR